MLCHKKTQKSRHVGNIIMWRHWKLTSLENTTTFEKNNLTENNNNNNNWKSSKISKSVTENMNVSLNWRKQNMGREYFSFVRLSSNRREDKCSPAHFEIPSILSSEKSFLIQSNHTAKNTGIQGFPRKDILPNKYFALGWWWQELNVFSVQTNNCKHL